MVVGIERFFVVLGIVDGLDLCWVVIKNWFGGFVGDLVMGFKNWKFILCEVDELRGIVGIISAISHTKPQSKINLI